MEVNNIVQFLEDRTILVTGGTGFLAKGSLSVYLSLCHSLSFSLNYVVDMTFLFDITVMVEKILRVQPNVKKLYLLIRACDLEEAIKRFQMEVCLTLANVCVCDSQSTLYSNSCNVAQRIFYMRLAKIQLAIHFNVTFSKQMIVANPIHMFVYKKSDR
ncbi:putative alcohol-forming fatty acyl-CoA reductase [Helianthus annuus]|uniref:Fatty acyl-CoA reductase n=1 Tax=Helianthus annuus TaxID=4232 RepID=A0A251TI62_HELAN|nr:putative alcohol-forming fatty acyl-CoA reductase [Helianthus annuus]KAJ0879873.1 putative alcohol-forming fatty acyl-CoA reductase [Helianthus annuus]